MRQMNLQQLDNVYKSRNGIYMRDCIINSLKEITDNRKVLFMGYARPYLDTLVNSDVFYVIPEQYEFEKNPMPLSKKTIRLEDGRLPFPAKSFDVIIPVHLLEFSRYAADFLNEISRILEDQGQMVSISFTKHTLPIKCRSVNELVELIEGNDNFEIYKITGMSLGLRVWPYDFKLNISKHSELLINALPFISDLVLIQTNKNELAPIEEFNPTYGIANG